MFKLQVFLSAVIFSDEYNSAFPALSLNLFCFKLLNFLGYGVEIRCCVNCSTGLLRKNNYFSAKHGGILCKKCFIYTNDGIPVNENSIKMIRIFLKNNIRSLEKLKIGRKELDNLEIITRNLLNWIT